MNDIDNLIERAREDVSKARDPKELELVKAKYLGKSGSINALLRGLSDLPIDRRKSEGARINERKGEFLAFYDRRKMEMEDELLRHRLEGERLDVSLPGRGDPAGSLHPITLAQRRVEQLFMSMGFEVVDGPEIEKDYYNFQALNIPANHPARDMQDTFYVENGDVLRTHTSPIQIRHMLRKKTPPMRCIAPGRVYRVDSDATHSPMFTQCEGLWIEPGVTMVDLKSIFTIFLRRFFEDEDLIVRFRPSYFPFTEPSAEIDIMGENGWLEVGGCGMTRPEVLENVGVDPEVNTGFAFGIGIDRFAMLRYGVDDIRLFFDNDLRFLKQFK